MTVQQQPHSCKKWDWLETWLWVAECVGSHMPVGYVSYTDSYNMYTGIHGKCASECVLSSSGIMSNWVRQ